MCRARAGRSTCPCGLVVNRGGNQVTRMRPMRWGPVLARLAIFIAVISARLLWPPATPRNEPRSRHHVRGPFLGLRRRKPSGARITTSGRAPRGA